MTAVIQYPSRGRGAWPSSGLGGTFKADGTAVGRFFRAPASGSGLAMIGLVGRRADLNNAQCSIDDYACYRGVLAAQVELSGQGLKGPDGSVLALDGIWGPAMDFAVKTWQTKNHLTADGVFGPATAQALWTPLAKKSAEAAAPGNADVLRVMLGTVKWESGWDPAAVGSDPHDAGLGQINGPAHPNMSLDQRLSPNASLPYVARLVRDNLAALDGVIEDGIVAYNLGVGGARSWVNAGRPDTFNGRDIRRYINEILGTT